MSIRKNNDIVPLDNATEERLRRFASGVGLTPGEAAAALLRDLLADQDFWDAAANPDGSIVTH